MIPQWRHSFMKRAFGDNKGKEVLEVLKLAEESIVFAKAKGVNVPTIEGGMGAADEMKAVAFFDTMAQDWGLRFTGSKHWFPSDPDLAGELGVSCAGPLHLRAGLLVGGVEQR